MIAPLAKFIDWLAIQVLAILLPRFNARNPRLEEAIQLLKGPDFIPAESQPAQVECVASVSLRSGKNSAPAGFRRFDVAGRATPASQPQPAAAMAC
jgi:hypothetical protein